MVLLVLLLRCLFLHLFFDLGDLVFELGANALNEVVFSLDPLRLEVLVVLVITGKELTVIDEILTWLFQKLIIGLQLSEEVFRVLLDELKILTLWLGLKP